jgi:hypothetical protein
VVLLALLVFGVAAGAPGSLGGRASAQSSPTPTLASLTPFQKRFTDYQQDFLQMSKAGPAPSVEYDIETDLANIAGQALDYIDSTTALVFIYENLSCENDKAMTRAIARPQISTYVKMVAALANEANTNLSYTKVPAVSTTAINMKADLRSLRDSLDSLQRSME